MKRIIYIIVGCVCLLSSCFRCENTVECPLWYEFTLPFNVENLVDTISVGDTFQISHNVPRFLVENTNGMDYDISSIFIDYENQASVGIGKLEGNQLLTLTKEDISFLSISNFGKVVCQQIAGGCFNRITFEENQDGFFFKCNVVVNQPGLHLGGFSYSRDEVEKYNNIDSRCCQRYQKINFNYSFNEGEGNNREWIGQDSIWYSDGGLERSILELIAQSDFFMFYVKE